MQPEMSSVAPWTTPNALPAVIRTNVSRNILPLGFMTMRSTPAEDPSQANDVIDMHTELVRLTNVCEAKQREFDSYKMDAEAHLAEERAQSQAMLDEIQHRQTDAIIALTDEFRDERARYFAAVEEKVVRLALSIAARVLQREAALDPLFLRGAVHVALSEIPAESTCVLHVSAADEPAWQQYLHQTPRAGLTIAVDQKLLPGECRLSTHAGTADLSAKAQLLEIEDGFLELLQQRPRA